MAGDVISDPIIKKATGALKAGGGDSRDVRALVEANKELLSLHELIGHRIFQILIGAHCGRHYAV